MWNRHRVYGQAEAEDDTNLVPSLTRRGRYPTFRALLALGLWIAYGIAVVLNIAGVIRIAVPIALLAAALGLVVWVRVSARRHAAGFAIDEDQRTWGAADRTDFGLPADFFAWEQQRRKLWVKRVDKPPAEGLNLVTGARYIVRDKADARAIDSLTTIVERDPSAGVQRLALLKLRATHDEAAVPGLMLGLQCDDLTARANAIIGLQDLKAREAVPILISYLDDGRRLGFDEMRSKAARALVKIGDERALEPLRDQATKGPSGSRRLFRNYSDQLATALGRTPDER